MHKERSHPVQRKGLLQRAVVRYLRAASSEERAVLYPLHDLIDGASLLFVSDKGPINYELFYHYLMHRLYSFPFRYKAIVDEKTRIFIPSGFDSLTLIQFERTFTTREMTKNAESKPFEEVFKAPARAAEDAKIEILCDDFNLLLAQWEAGQKQPRDPLRSALPKPNPSSKVNPVRPGANPSALTASPNPSLNSSPTTGAGLSPEAASAAGLNPRPSQTGKGANAGKQESKMASIFWDGMKDKTGAAVSEDPSFL